jgi:hypothetical protein
LEPVSKPLEDREGTSQLKKSEKKKTVTLIAHNKAMNSLIVLSIFQRRGHDLERFSDLFNDALAQGPRQETCGHRQTA